MSSEKKVGGGNGDFLAVAKITACFGVKGKLRVQLFSKDDLHLNGVKKIRIGHEDSDTEGAELNTVEYQQKSVVISVEGVNDRTGAESLVGKLIFLDKSSISPPQTGKYYVHDIIGCEVFSVDGERLGQITDVLKLPSHDIWEVTSGPKNILIPAVKNFIRGVDIKSRKIIIDPIEGLLD